MNIAFESEKFFLDFRICSENHKWNNTSKCLRYKKNKRCVQCVRNRLAKQKKEHPDRIRKYKKTYAQKHPEKIREWNNTYDKKHREKRKKYSREYYKANIEKIKLRQSYYDKFLRNKEAKKLTYKRYSKTENGSLKIRIKASRRRARLAGCHHAPFDKTGILKLFDGQCAYCKIVTDKLTLDHLIPITSGGPHCQSNLVPACMKCNISKNNHEAHEWYKKQTFYSVKQWKEILKVLGKTNANYTQLPLF